MHKHHLQDMDREQIQSGARSAEGLHKRSGRRRTWGAPCFSIGNVRGALLYFSHLLDGDMSIPRRKPCVHGGARPLPMDHR